MSQPTRTTSLPTRPTRDPLRAELMGALALAEHLVSLGEPVPANLQVRFMNAKAVVDLMLLTENPSEIAAYQERFGGTVKARLNCSPGYAPSLLTELTGTVFDGQFRVWVLTGLSEREFAARFLDENVPYEDWSPETHLRYEAAIDAIRARNAL